MLSHLKKPVLFYLATFIFSLNFAFCQTYYFSHYQAEEGLSNNAVICSLQDHQGFLWFGTRDGLNRFDGVSFKIFRNNINNPKSIGSNSIMCLSEDDSGRIWVGTEKGLFKYDGKTESFSKLKVAGDNSIRQVKVVGSNIWYILLYTLYRYNDQTGELKSYKIGKEVSSYSLIKNNKHLWISTSLGTIINYDDSNDSFKEYDLFNKSPNSVSKWIETLFDTGKGLLLVGTSNQGLKVFDIKTSSYNDILTFNADKTEIIVREILPVKPDEYWIATQSGIFILNIKTGKYINLAKQQNDPYSLSDNIVHTLCKDKEGGIWAGTYFGGINYYPRQYITFKKYFPKFCTNSISGSAVREICNDNKGNLWIGTEDAGLNKFNPLTEHFTNFNPQITKQSVSYSNIHGLLINGEEIWAGTYLHGLDILNVKNGNRIRNYNTGNCSIGSNFIYSIFKTRADEIIAATDKGLYQFISDKHNFKLLATFPKIFYRTLWQDNEGTMWAGTYGDGIFFYNSKTGRHGNFKFEPNNKNSLVNNLINKIFEDSNGTLWFATEGGLCKYEKKTNSFVSYTTASGFPANVTYALLEDAKRNLWISTSKGLVCLSPEQKIMKVYTKANGLLTDQFNYSSAYKDITGRMYFGSVKGLVSFHPDSIENSTYLPPVFITGFQVYNKELLIDQEGSPLKTSITFAKEITLSFKQSSFSIDFAALSYTAPTTNQYAYKMIGLDRDWTVLQTNRKVYFTELNPGTYTFIVKAINGSTNDVGQAAVLTIKILPPFWKSWWAYTLYIIAVISITSLIIRYYIARAKEKNERNLERLQYDKERENYKDKMEFFTNIAHEIRTPLTLIKGPMENIMERADEVPMIKSNLAMMNRNTDKLLHLSNQLLDFRKVEMNGFRLTFSREDIANIISDVFSGFKVIAEEKKLDITINSPNSFYAYIDVEAFNKIVSNLLDNAIKYAKSKVHIELSGNANTFTVTFKNDGYLIPLEIREKIFKSFYRAKETARLPGTGIGLTLSRSLTEMHQGTLILDIAENDLNVFILTMPVNPEQIQ